MEEVRNRSAGEQWLPHSDKGLVSLAFPSS